VQLKTPHSRHIQGTLRTDIINNNLQTDDLFQGQVLQGYVDSKEEHGYTIQFNRESNILGFYPK